MRVLIFDTETTGKIQKLNKFHKPSIFETDCWPRIVELAWVLYEDEGQVLSKEASLILPDNFVIPEESIKIHNISNALAKEEGLPLNTVLLSFLEAVKTADVLVAHNIEFDMKVLCSELARQKRLDDIQILQHKRNFCTMLTGTSVCQIPSPYGNYKWPSLAELYRKLLGTEMGQAHRAMFDVEATASCFFKLLEMKRITL